KINAPSSYCEDDLFSRLSAFVLSFCGSAMATSLRQQPQLESRMNQESAQRREISTPVDVTNAVLQLICSGYFHDETDDHPKFDIAKQGLLIEKELGLSHLTKIKSGGFGIVYKGQLQDKNGTKKL